MSAVIRMYSGVEHRVEGEADAVERIVNDSRRAAGSYGRRMPYLIGFWTDADEQGTSFYLSVDAGRVESVRAVGAKVEEGMGVG